MLSLVGFAICIHSIGLQTGSPANPGPGFMPFGTGILLLILSLVGIFKKVIGEKGKEPWAEPHNRRVIVVIASIIGYALALTTTGFVLATFLLMVLLFRMTGYNRWLPIVIKAVLCAGLSYLIFDKWLGCQLPEGILGF